MPKISDAVVTTQVEVEANGTGDAAPEAAKAPRPKKPAAAPKAPAKNGDRKVLYPTPETLTKQIITVEQAKKLLGWESESACRARLQLKEGSKARLVGPEGQKMDPLCKDEEGNRIFTWNNQRNRPFDLTHAKRLAQTILLGEWRWNGEAIIISQYGTVLSGQHRLVALVLAWQMWANDVPNGRWRSHWGKEVPTLESNVTLGVPEDGKTVMTIDNVKPRSEADVFYTSKIFEKEEASVRKELSGMLAAAVDLVWNRSGAGNNGGTKIHKTHQEACAFLDRHKKLVDAVRHIYAENNPKDGRAIGALKLLPGQAAGMLYLMAASGSDGDVYRAADNPSERQMDLAAWEKAEEFWTLLAAGSKDTDPVKAAISDLIDTEGVGRPLEKLSIVALGWKAFAECGKVTAEDVDLSPFIALDDDGNQVLVDPPAFGGIDQGVKADAPKDPDVSPEEAEDEKAQIRREAAEAAKARVEAARNAEPEGDEPASAAARKRPVPPKKQG